jgi:hypothetical protein
VLDLDDNALGCLDIGTMDFTIRRNMADFSAESSSG